MIICFLILLLNCKFLSVILYELVDEAANDSDYASDYDSDIDKEEAIFNHISNY